MTKRYLEEQHYGKTKFSLQDYLPNEEECKFILIKVVEQATRDYCSLSSYKTQSEKDKIGRAHV